MQEMSGRKPDLQRIICKTKNRLGRFPEVVFKLSPQGKPIVTKRPDMSNVEWSEAQKAQRQRFKQATAYAKAALADPKLRARYENRARSFGSASAALA